MSTLTFLRVCCRAPRIRMCFCSLNYTTCRTISTPRRGNAEFREKSIQSSLTELPQQTQAISEARKVRSVAFRPDRPGPAVLNSVQWLPRLRRAAQPSHSFANVGGRRVLQTSCVPVSIRIWSTAAATPLFLPRRTARRPVFRSQERRRRHRTPKDQPLSVQPARYGRRIRMFSSSLFVTRPDAPS